MMTSSWQGRRIVVTRPIDQAAALAEGIERRGGTAIRFPVLAVSPLADQRALRAAAQRLPDCDYAVFVSPNAVRFALAALLAEAPWPSRAVAVAVGPGSARALVEGGVERVLSPQSGAYDSEALLALPEFAEPAIRGRSVMIFRAARGRELLGETLAARGARVERIVCYRRRPAQPDVAALRALLRDNALDALTVTSSEALRHLLALLGAESAPALKQVPLLASHRRIGELARQLGFARVVVTAPGDAGLLSGLSRQFGEQETD